MNIIAHKSKDGREQSLQEHGQNVAKMAASFAAPFGGEKFAERIGISHDAGKDTVGFQQYIQAPDKNAKSPHAIIAAALNCQANDVLSAVITAGHHSGLHNVLDTITNVRAALAERSQDITTAREYFSSDAISQTEIIPEFARKNKVFGQYAFTKMEFSCLTDADYQDTERFMRGYSPRSYDYDSFSDIYDMFRKHVQPWIDKDNEMMRRKNQPFSKDEEINHMRTQMMLQCLDAGSNSRKGDIRTLSIPTGGSKTLSSFAYAIAAAKKDKSIKRIIVVIPFNTITTQTASVLRGIVGEKNILENHSGFDFEDSKQDKLLQYASENWDIPIVVTTNVQFFESFFSNKPAKSRKLHNIADSVIIFDEVQQLPVKYLKPCIKCIESLAANFGARIVLSTKLCVPKHFLNAAGSAPVTVIPVIAMLRNTPPDYFGQNLEVIPWRTIVQHLLSEDDKQCVRFVLRKWEAANPEEAALGNPLGYKDVSRRRYAEKLDSIGMTHCLYGDLENILPKEFSVARI